MRSAVMILALLLVLGGVFFLVVLRDRPAMYVSDAATQAATRPTSRAVVPSTIATLHPENSMIGQSNGVWMQTLDRRPDHLGRLAKEFRFERLDPRPDDAVNVTQPRARFYNDNGSIITLEGTDGVVVYTQGGSHADPKAIGTATPDNGIFRNVTIRVFDTAASTQPSTTATLPAVRFDANDNRIATVDCVIDGRGVLADQVPVKVRGDDYEFDGRGLTMRWNDRDGRLEDLEIRHGQRLLIRDVSKVDHTDRPPVVVVAPPEPVSQATPAFSLTDLFDGIVMAQPTTERASKASQRRAADRAAAAATREAVVAPPTTRRVRGQALYYAHFEQDVRVFRSGVLIATADTMNVTLPSNGDHPAADADATTAPAPVEVPTPAAAPARVGKHARPAPATRPARRVAPPPPKPITPATTRAASTRPAEPLEVFWTGPLTVHPATPETTPAGGGKMVEFIGAPAHVIQGSSTIDGRLIHVEPDAGLARVEPGGPVKTIALHLGESTELRSGSALLVDRDAGLATIEGPGMLRTDDAAATRPTSRATTAPARGPTTAVWDKRMELRLENFGDDPDAPQWLDEITLEGDASVASDDFTMNGDVLTFNFDEPDAVPVSKAGGESMLATPEARFLRFATADGNARVEAGAVDERRTLVGDSISLGVVNENGAAALTTIVAEDDVAMIDARGTELYCDKLDAGVRPITLVAATTRPTTRGATTKVATTKATSKPTSRPDERDAFALLDKLVATGGVRLKQVDGSNASGDALTLDVVDGRKTIALTGAPATAGSPRATLSGARLVLNPATNDVDVPGAGTMTSADPAKPGSTGNVTWTDSLAFTSADSTVKIHGGVAIDNREETGSTLHATADRATLVLASNATTRPSATTRPVTRPTSGDGMNSIRTALLDGNVDVTVDTIDYRHANVQTVELSIDVEHNVVTADHPGRMLMVDRRGDPSTRPSTQPSTQPATMPTTGPTTDATTEPTSMPATTEPSTEPTTAPTTGPTTRHAKPKPIGAPTLLAIKWNDRLRWDLLPGTLTMTGGVHVGYERGTPGERVQIRSRRLDATLAPIDLGATQSTTRPTTASSTRPTTRATTPEFDLRTVHARDDVYVISPRASFNASTLDYDLSSDLAYASGDADRNVQVYDAVGGSSVGFSRITWNVVTGAITDFRDISGRIRR